MTPDQTSTESVGRVYEFWVACDQPSDTPAPVSPKALLGRMRARVQLYGRPLPDGYVPPPGIDLDALLKEVPWPPAAE